MCIRDRGVPADRIICAVPFYSRIWHGDGSSVSSETISMPNMQAYIAEHELTPVWEDDIAPVSYTHLYLNTVLYYWQ